MSADAARVVTDGARGLSAIGTPYHPLPQASLLASRIDRADRPDIFLNSIFFRLYL